MSKRPKRKTGRQGPVPSAGEQQRSSPSRPEAIDRLDESRAAVLSDVPEPTVGAGSARGFGVHLALAFLAGTILRLAFVTTAVLLDDEWHAMDYSLGNSLGFLLTHFSVPGATSIPMNVYTWLLLRTTGWNETLLRLPALVPGVASLVILPWLVRQAFSRRTTTMFAWLLAICPFLIFYSRIARPYGMVALAGAAVVLCGYLWLVSGRRLHAVLFVVSSVVAVYFHLFAAIPAVATLGCGILFKLLPAGVSSGSERIIPSSRDLALVSAAIASALAALLLPALVHAAGGTFSSVLGAGEMTTTTLARFASLLSGTSNRPLMVMFFCFLAVGVAVLSRNKPLFSAMVVVNAVLSYLGLVVTHPDLVDTALVVSRYVVALFPLALVAVAYGIDTSASALGSIGARRRSSRSVRALGALAAATFVALLLALGPIPGVAYRPNNFTGHSAFLESYAPLRWDHSYRSEMLKGGPVIEGTKRLSAFYHQLASDAGCTTIIEYPMFLGNHFNLYYYSQHLHRKRVLVGYFPGLNLHNVRSNGWINGNDYADYVMSRVPDPARLKMSSMVDVSSAEAVRGSGAAYLILHRHLMKEMFPRAVDASEPDYAPVEYLVRAYRHEFGEPVFEDTDLAVFRTGLPSSGSPSSRSGGR